MLNNALQAESMKKLFISIAGRKGISVVFDPECKVPNADAQGKVTLPVPSVENAQDLWMFAFHELSHLLEELEWSYTELPKRINLGDPVAMAVANCIMDNLCERNFFGEYEGVDYALDEGRARMTLPILNLNQESFKDKIQALFWTMIHQDAQERGDWMEVNMQALLFPEMGTKDTQYINQELTKINFMSRLKGILPAKDSSLVCEKLIRDILKIVDYEPEEMPMSGKPSSGEETEGEGTEEETEETEGETKGETEGELNYAEHRGHNPDGIGRPDSLEWSKKKRMMSKEELKEILEELRKDSTKRPDSSMERHEKIGWRGRGDAYIPWKDHKVLKLEDTYQNFQERQRKAIHVALGASTVSKQISKFLKTLASESYTYGQRRGRLHTKSLHKLVSNSGTSSQRPAVFKTKDSTKIKTDSAVQLLLDCSGSMSGSKYSIGAACCVAISDTLTALGIAHEVLGFTESSCLESYIFKSYGNPMTKEKLMQVMSHNEIDLYNNADGESVLWAAQRLLDRKESRKLQVVLSDGYPSGSFNGDGDAYLKKVCSMLEDESPIDLIGIGIRTDAVSRFYKKNVVVNRTEELDQVLFGVLKDFLV